MIVSAALDSEPIPNPIKPPRRFIRFRSYVQMADLLEIKSLVEEQGKAWEEFQAKNDERIAAVEALA